MYEMKKKKSLQNIHDVKKYLEVATAILFSFIFIFVFILYLLFFLKLITMKLRKRFFDMSISLTGLPNEVSSRSVTTILKWAVTYV